MRIIISYIVMLGLLLNLSGQTTDLPMTAADKKLNIQLDSSLSTLFKDAARPTLSNCGKGLLYYDCILLKHQDKVYLFKSRGEEKPSMVKATFTESDLAILKYNMLFIEKQYQTQIKERIRQDRLDWNLGEMIKGFYMKPVF